MKEQHEQTAEAQRQEYRDRDQILCWEVPFERSKSSADALLHE
jgi:hypothetical protein